MRVGHAACLNELHGMEACTALLCHTLLCKAHPQASPCPEGSPAGTAPQQRRRSSTPTCLATVPRPWLPQRMTPLPPCPPQLPPGYTLDRMEEGDIVAKKAEPLLERFDSGSGLPVPEP